MSFISIILAIIILSILVIIHEYGHFLLARKNGIFVKEFSVGFGPRIISKEAKSGTRFSLKAIPFGGSCTMLGALEDEDDETDDERSFDKKSVWARMSVILAGPFFNFFLAFILAVVITAAAGYDPAVVTSSAEGTPAYEAGLREGDLITSYGGTSVSFSREISLENYLNPISARTDGIKITYKRDGQKYKTVLYPEEYTKYMIGLSYYPSDDPAAVASVVEDGASDLAGLEEGDIITSLNGTAIGSGNELAAYFDKNELDGSEITVTYIRRGGNYETVLHPLETTGYTTGLGVNTANVKTDALNTLKYSLAEVRYEIVTVYKSLGILITGRGSFDMLSGPVGIVEVISDTYEASAPGGFAATLINMLSIMMLLSANLGVINLLPIPALDGGKFLLLIIEAITRKPVPKKVEGVITVVGAALIAMLAIAVLVKDVVHLF